ncbi:hypothetical protein PULV_a3747 [Pseudoalteromonas ulvae UL12]|uniref:hypothetical protein n=1 Tax=Pseudoalteromonas ulvae TaxID=107327 RepID=UPI00186B7D71|nr:hypothetical protein [Pseudoalteromonas ulvae]MBE0362062.1 hypothetical protein [Pseudoalteromonas ulvae UL12]
MRNKNVIRALKGVMFFGIGLILVGHYLLSGMKLHETMGVTGIMIIAACIAIGLIMSLPTKIYLTILLMKNEQEHSSH